MRDLKLLNLQRWQAHVDALGSGIEPGEREAPTAGVLFNRANPRNLGKFVKPYNRETDKQEPMRGHQTWVSPRDYRRVEQPSNPKDWQTTRQAVPQQGADFTSVAVTSVHKYRIPNTSVTRKEGDLKLFLCCGWRLTAAQWIWCVFIHSNPLHSQTHRNLCWQVAQLFVLCRALAHDLRHALLCLLPARAQLAHRDRAPHDPHLPHPQRAHAVHA